ncbi:MAG: PDR/VanB family oxidoreductase [Pseudomonadota bacterium]
MTNVDGTLTVLIRARTDIATDIVGLTLEPLDGGPLPEFVAGAHIDVHLAPGLTRQYSLANNPCETHRYKIGVLRDPKSRGGSIAVHQQLKVGELLRIGKPRCNFPLNPAATSSVLIAGGIGITPILSMAYRLHATGQDFSVHYTCRSRDRAAFVDELTNGEFASRANLYFDDAAADDRFNLERTLLAAGRDADIYVCGPGGFINFVVDGARALDWKESKIHVEHFGADVSTAGASFVVEARKSGVEVRVLENQTISQALAAAGVCVPVSCEQGVCGTCLTRVLDGKPDHRDFYQTDDEKAAGDFMTPCCSRSLGERIVLDL